MQDEYARIILDMAEEDQSVYVLTPEEEASFAISRAQADRGEFASEEQVEAVFAKYGL